MKTVLRILAFLLCAQCVIAQDGVRAELQRIAVLQAALDGDGIDGLRAHIRREASKVPHMPSQWHVEYRSTSQERPVALAARALGKALLVRLTDEAVPMQQLSADEALYVATVRLLDLSEWCGAVEGYGNLFLARRCLDLAAVGVTRLTANLDFPIERIDGLLARLQPAWMSPEASLRILNWEAGAPIFTTPDREEMERVWGAGNTAKRHKANPKLREDMVNSGIIRKTWSPPRISQAAEENLAFFDDTESSQIGMPTSLNIWDKKLHGAFVNGFELQNVSMAVALAEFRRRIGAFPTKLDLTEEQIRARERRIVEAAKQGIKISRFEDAFRSPIAAAFAQAWRRYLETETDNLGKIPRQRFGLDAPAGQAYSEVMQEQFLDLDSRYISLDEAQKRPQTSKP